MPSSLAPLSLASPRHLALRMEVVSPDLPRSGAGAAAYSSPPGAVHVPDSSNDAAFGSLDEPEEQPLLAPSRRALTREHVSPENIKVEKPTQFRND